MFDADFNFDSDDVKQLVFFFFTLAQILIVFVRLISVSSSRTRRRNGKLRRSRATRSRVYRAKDRRHGWLERGKSLKGQNRLQERLEREKSFRGFFRAPPAFWPHTAKSHTPGGSIR